MGVRGTPYTYQCVEKGKERFTGQVRNPNAQLDRRGALPPSCSVAAPILEPPATRPPRAQYVAAYQHKDGGTVQWRPDAKIEQKIATFLTQGKTEEARKLVRKCVTGMKYDDKSGVRARKAPNPPSAIPSSCGEMSPKKLGEMSPQKTRRDVAPKTRRDVAPKNSARCRPKNSARSRRRPPLGPAA